MEVTRVPSAEREPAPDAPGLDDEELEPFAAGAALHVAQLGLQLADPQPQGLLELQEAVLAGAKVPHQALAQRLRGRFLLSRT
jgi:hypothetical protein